MDKFIIEVFQEGEMLHDEVVGCDNRLLNEQDLDVITLGKDKGMLFVRREIDTTSGYYLDGDNRWNYGLREMAINQIKRRL